MPNELQYWDRDGREVFPNVINTICPIAHADRARLLAHQYMTTIEAGVDMTVDQMLTTLLAPVGSGEPTHIFCSREGFCHQVESEVEFLASRPESWCGRVKYQSDSVPQEVLGLFCCVVGDVSTMLDRLGLREVVH